MSNSFPIKCQRQSFISDRSERYYLLKERRKILKRKEEVKGNLRGGSSDWEPEQNAKSLLLEVYWAKTSNCIPPSVVDNATTTTKTTTCP